VSDEEWDGPDSNECKRHALYRTIFSKFAQKVFIEHLPGAHKAATITQQLIITINCRRSLGVPRGTGIAWEKT
jgi:hypothetical protein